jgi:DNA-binding FadR family transcriptional regulator
MTSRRLPLRAGPGGVAEDRVRAPKVSELIAARLRRRIVLGELNASMETLSEADLLAQFGVSRPTLREALRVLESERLISIHRGIAGGVRVHSPSEDVAAKYAALVLQFRGTRLQDVYDTRAILEVPCARIVAQRSSPDDCARLREALQAAREVQNSPAIAIGVHMTFHDLLVELAGLQTLTVLHGMVRHIVDTVNLTQTIADAGTSRNDLALRKGFRTHEELVELVAAGRAHEAEDLWRRHLAESDLYMLSKSQGKTVVDLLE